MQLHAHLTGSSFRGETISTMLEVGLTSFSLLASELLKTLQKEKKLITRPDTCQKKGESKSYSFLSCIFSSVNFTLGLRNLFELFGELEVGDEDRNCSMRVNILAPLLLREFDILQIDLKTITFKNIYTDHLR